MTSTVAAAHARMTSGKKRLEYAESFLATVRKLFTTGAKTQDEVDQADVDFVESQVDYLQDVLIWEAMKSIVEGQQRCGKWWQLTLCQG